MTQSRHTLLSGYSDKSGDVPMSFCLVFGLFKPVMSHYDYKLLAEYSVITIRLEHIDDTYVEVAHG